MVILHIEHSISDFDLWKNVFDERASWRQGFGARSHRVLRPVDDPNYVMIDIGFDTAEAAASFLAALRELWGTPGATPALASATQTHIVNVVESKQY